MVNKIALCALVHMLTRATVIEQQASDGNLPSDACFQNDFADINIGEFFGFL